MLGPRALLWDGRLLREATLTNRLKSSSGDGATLLAVGDHVTVEEGGADACRILSVGPRETYLGRVAAGRRNARMQVVAANAEQAVIVASLAEPPFRPGLVDRWTLLARRGNMIPILCVNKIDLGEPGAAARALEEESIALDWVAVSAETGEGIEALRERLVGRATAFVGHSGVGKSSLLTRLFPGTEIVTGALSEKTRKGRHTTTGARLHALPEGGHIIDTPGIRSVPVGETDPLEAAAIFPEIHEAPPCRFRPCTHRAEPGCSVLAALATGAIPRRVYDRYRKLLDEAGAP